MTRNMRDMGRAIGVSALMAAAACGGDSTGPRADDPTQVFRVLRLNHNAAMIALTPPYDTVRLAVTAYGLDETLFAHPGTTTYFAADSTVTITADGLVRAQYVTDSTMVIAKMQVNNVTIADTAIIRVTPTVTLPHIASFSIHTPGDSARIGTPEGAVTFFPADFAFIVAKDAAGNIVSDSTNRLVLTYFKSSNPTVAQIDHTSGGIFPYLPGHVTYYANAYVYGATYQDSLKYVANYVLATTIGIVKSVSKTTGDTVQAFSRPVVHVAVGGVVTWTGTTIPMDIVFDNPANVAAACPFNFCMFYPPGDAGNIPAFFYVDPGFVVRARKFPVAGTYEYHSELYHTEGTVIVSSVQ